MKTRSVLVRLAATARIYRALELEKDLNEYQSHAAVVQAAPGAVELTEEQAECGRRYILILDRIATILELAVCDERLKAKVQ